MKTLHRNKRKLYLCKAYEDNGRRKFHEPIELYENWNVTNTDGEFMNIGLELFNYARIRTSVEHADYYHVGDRVYLFTVPPVLPSHETTTEPVTTGEGTNETGENTSLGNEEVQTPTEQEGGETTEPTNEETPTSEEEQFDEYCLTADYQVYKDPITTLNECTVWLQKLSGKNGNNTIY